MAYKAYLSEIAPWWTIERQEALLSGAVPGWPPNVGVFIDRLTVRQRRAHQPGALTARATLLRPTSRPSAGEIFVASLAVLAWGEDDFRTVLEATRKFTVHAIGDGVVIPSGPIDADEAVASWQAARTKSRIQGAALLGAAVSAERRGRRVIEGCAKIKDRWGMPADKWSTKALLAEAGEPGKPIAYNSAVKILGGREPAQRIYEAKHKRRATMAAKKEAKGK